MLVIGVDKKSSLPVNRSMFQRSGGTEVSESYINHGGALRILTNMWWDVGRANILPIGVPGFTVIT